jgi:hypothetical protein
MNNDKAKSEILDWCSQRVECLARSKIIDEVGTLDAPQSASSVSEEEIDASGAPHSGIRRFSPVSEEVDYASVLQALRDLLAISIAHGSINGVQQSYFKQLAQVDWPAGHAPTAQQWQPIATAPKMKVILLFAVTDVDDDGRVRNWKMATGSWHTGWEDDQTQTAWFWDGYQVPKYATKPTHWMPLPDAPTLSDTSTDGNCPRCKREPADKALLGSDDEGHICGTCWSNDRHADSPPEGKS